MTKMRATIVSLGMLGTVVTASVGLVMADNSAPSNTAADNTAVNKQDQTTSQPTADQANNNKTDVQTMQQIRKAIVADKSLSTSAHNVKIIAQNGHVTLKGPVQSDAERSSVEAKACSVAGKENVTNELTIKGS